MHLLGISLIVLLEVCAGFVDRNVLSRPADIRLLRQKRLSVLSIVYRRANSTNSPNHLPPPPSDQPLTTMSPAPTRPTIAPSELTTTIAKLRTTRLHFSMTTRAPPAAPVEPVVIHPGENARLYPLTPKLIEGGASVPAAFLPYFPPSGPEKVTLTFLPSPIGGRSTELQPIRPPPFATEAEVAPPANGGQNHGPVHSEHPVRPPGWAAPPSPPTSTAPSLQARLHVQTERKHKPLAPTQPLARDTTPIPAEWSPLNIQALNQAVTGIPANLSCNGRIGYFSDPAPGCDVFLYCDQFGRSFRFVCPQGTHFNSRLCLCDMHTRCGKAGEFGQMHSMSSMSDPCPPLT